jgi:hypothetical protein
LFGTNYKPWTFAAKGFYVTTRITDTLQKRNPNCANTRIRTRTLSSAFSTVNVSKDTPIDARFPFFTLSGNKNPGLFLMQIF